MKKKIYHKPEANVFLIENNLMQTPQSTEPGQSGTPGGEGNPSIVLSREMVIDDYWELEEEEENIDYHSTNYWK